MAKYKYSIEVNELPILAVISQQCLDCINSLFGTNYKRKSILEQKPRIDQPDQSEEFDRIMRQIPGFNRHH
jgi:hypothetical protein